MSKFDNWRRAGAALAAVGGLLVSTTASAGLVDEKNATTVAGSAQKTAPGYLLRCWQEGRLIVEERLATLPPTVDLTAAKLRALDTDNQAVYVTETKNATCLIRARLAEHTRRSSQ